MAEVASDASGLASPKPSTQGGSSDAPDKGKLRVFISYSRDDLYFADQLGDALNACGFECSIDRHGITGGEDWKRRLANLIREADTVVFVLSPTSARSEICAWEVQEATRFSKRIVPVNLRPLEGASPPPELRERNYIFFYDDPKAAPGSGFGTGLAKLVAALNTDFDWLREHTRYLQRATEWDRGGRPANRLMSGDDIAEAKAWAGRRPKNAPEATALHLDFIRASEEEAEARSNAQRKQLEEMAAAQTERETALHEREEALKQAADAQRKRARIRNIALVVVSIFAVLANWLYVKADQQRKVAEEQKAAAIAQRAEAQQQREIADRQRAIVDRQRAVVEEQSEQADQLLEAAKKIITVLYAQMDIDTQKQVFAIFQTGADRGDALSMHSLGWAYEREFGVTQDYVKAREWYEKAAAKGSARAMTDLALLYDNGRGVTQDYVKAREWYEKAADKGDGFAMSRLGLLYVNGQGVVQDYAKAREWFEKAADKGYPPAMGDLGALYYNGQGVAQDNTKAREWFEKAADKGYAYAMRSLASLYRDGRGVAQDYAKAREWYEKAANKGDATAKVRLEELAILEAGGVKKELGDPR
jgi:TPR repeat protein